MQQEEADRIGRALNFTREDLEANHHGYMSKPQRVRLHRMAGWKWIVVHAVVFSIVFGISMLSLRNLDVDTAGRAFLPLAELDLAALVLAMVEFFVLVFEINKRRRLKTDLYKGSIRQICGLLYLSNSHDDLVIGDASEKSPVLQ